MTCRRQAKTSAAKRHLAKLAKLPCVVCGATPVEIHHPRPFSGALSKKCNDFLAIPVCPDCHRGSHNGIHGGAATWRIQKLTEYGALAKIIERLTT